ncbi:flagellar basal body-associated FliL family protein [Planococcus sp. YIM B11945]|uniref:flagellar basal body-associated FliL family protein n=1 Tax=Planococcus sp. YIM B11945 TaxID=3435410 RepID=UPI003D7D96D8
MKGTLIVIIAVAVIGAAAWFFLLKDKEAGAEEEKALTAEEVAALSIDTDVITTNLASEGHFGIVQFNILLSDEDAKHEAEKRTAEVRAAIISTVAGFTKEQLIGKDGIETLEKELFNKLSKIVEHGEVERVLVTEFKVQ